MSETVACLIAFSVFAICVVAIYYLSSRARCGKHERCRKAWKEIVTAPNWQSRAGAAILRLPLLLSLSQKAFGASIIAVLLQGLGAVCNFSFWEWALKRIEWIGCLLFATDPGTCSLTDA